MDDGARTLDVPPTPATTRPATTRAAEIVGSLTRAEKIAMLHQVAPAVERLGLREFHTGSEALHGVAWLGTATVFPQPVGLGATWDAGLLTRVGAAVGVEQRAKHAGDPTVSLNVWAPVVNPLRHPAWGRNEEGYSEDPHVTAWLATAYARGLRGDHPVFWRTVPTLKHAFAYNNETDRSVTSSQLRARVWHEYEAPAFRGPVEAGVVGAVMASYNLVNGRPAHLSGELLAQLRSWTDHDLLVVSDAAAPGFVVDLERYYDDPAEAHAAMLRAGVDSFTDNDANSVPTRENLTRALERGLLDDADVDRAVVRVLALRIATGELDPELDPFVEPADAIDLPAHRALAREAVARSVVVLENRGALPLASLDRSAPLDRVAVVGPHADLALHDWYSGTPPYAVGLATALRGEPADDRARADDGALADDGEPGAVDVADGADRVALRSTTTGRWVRALPGRGALVADGEDGPAADDGPGARVPADALHDLTVWDDGLVTLRSVGTGLLWTGGGWVVRADATRVGGWVAAEAFRRHVHADGTWSVQHHGSGRWVRVQHDEAGSLVCDADVLERAERFAPTVVRAGLDDVARAAGDAGTVVVVVGNDPHLGGREAVDRTSLELPPTMLDVWRTARAAARRAVLVVVSSYPYVLPDDLGADAVVWTSHGGQELGNGLADVLLGAEEPRGRLAQSWPARSEDVGDLLDYDVIAAGHTSWYARTAPRYGLGHGLTYGDVRYEGVRLDRTVAAADDVVRVTVDVANAGARDAHELVQVYVDADDLGLPYPHRLVAHRRVVVPAGGRLAVDLELPVADLAVWDTARGRFAVVAGAYALGAGPSSALVGPRTALAVRGEELGTWACVGRDVAPADADDLVDVELSDTTREAGTCVQVARRRTEGHAVLRRCDLRGATVVAAAVARTRPGAAGVRVEVRAAGAAGSGPDDARGWRTLLDADVPEGGGRYDWSRVSAALPADVGAAETSEVRVVVRGAARCATVSFSGPGQP